VTVRVFLFVFDALQRCVMLLTVHVRMEEFASRTVQQVLVSAVSVRMALMAKSVKVSTVVLIVSDSQRVRNDDSSIVIK
jgi:hypothetical protein